MLDRKTYCTNFSSKGSYANDTIERGPMMRVLIAMDRNRQKGKWLAIEHKALKWAKKNSNTPKDYLDKFPW